MAAVPADHASHSSKLTPAGSWTPSPSAVFAFPGSLIADKKAEVTLPCKDSYKLKEMAARYQILIATQVTSGMDQTLCVRL
jgi:hypothetical protein